MNARRSARIARQAPSDVQLGEYNKDNTPPQSKNVIGISPGISLDDDTDLDIDTEMGHSIITELTRKYKNKVLTRDRRKAIV